MRSVILLAVVTLAVICAINAQESTRLKAFRALLRNPVYVDSVLRCIEDPADKAPCDQHGSKIKRLLSQGVKLGQCNDECDADERVISPEILATVREKYPESFQNIVKKYPGSDPGTP